MFWVRSSHPTPHWLAAAAAALVWALAAGSALLWWLHLPGRQERLATPASMAPAMPDGQGAPGVLRALGHAAAPAADAQAQRRFELLGVIASPAGHGSALLAVDGQPPRAFVQGQSVGEGWRLQSVGAEGVRLTATEGASELELALPRKP